MKENSFYSDDFEELIRGKTEQYKMYPSENVWKGVHSALHTKRKWYIGSMAFLVTGILFMAGRELILPSNHPALHKSQTNAVADAAKSTNENTRPAPLAVLRPANTAATARHTDSNNTAQEWDPVLSGISITESHPVLSQSDLSEWLSHVVKLPAKAPDLDVIAATRGTTDEQHNAGDEQRGGAAGDGRGIADDQRIAGDGRVAADGRTLADGRASVDGRTPADARNQGTETGADALTAQNVIESLSAKGAQDARYAHTGASLETSRGNRNTVSGQSLEETAGTAARAKAREIAESEDEQRVNWLHDYAMNLLETTPKTGRTYLELTLSPTVSYRTMGGTDVGADKIYPLGINGMAPGGPNTYVDHRPGFGFEAGGSILYRLTRNLSVKGGLQFNFTRFPIKAYQESPGSATTTLQSSLGVMMDSMSSNGMPMARANINDYAVTVYNDYYQLSAPVGFELRVLGNERLQFNLAATIAPTYLLNSSAYVLSSGYTKYDKKPASYRKLNFYAGAEAFLSYRMGNIRWQIGPEFHTQLLSSYNSRETISESIKSYGLKLGITKSIP